MEVRRPPAGTNRGEAAQSRPQVKRRRRWNQEDLLIGTTITMDKHICLSSSAVRTLSFNYSHSVPSGWNFVDKTNN